MLWVLIRTTLMCNNNIGFCAEICKTYPSIIIKYTFYQLNCSLIFLLFLKFLIFLNSFSLIHFLNPQALAFLLGNKLPTIYQIQHTLSLTIILNTLFRGSVELSCLSSKNWTLLNTNNILRTNLSNYIARYTWTVCRNFLHCILHVIHK